MATNKNEITALADLVAQVVATQAAQAAMSERLLANPPVRAIETPKQERIPMRKPRAEDYDLANCVCCVVRYKRKIKRYNAEAKFRRSFYS